jgi:hypothetical protein
MKKLVIGALAILAILVFLGCTQNTNQVNDLNGESDFSDMPFDPNAVCPYECCKDNDEMYYGKECFRRGAECIDHVCIVPDMNDVPRARTQSILAENELYTGVFLRIIDNYETALILNEYNGYPQYGPIGIYSLGVNEEGEIFDVNSNAIDKVVVVEIEIDNRSFDGNYMRAEQNFEEALRFYLANSNGTEYMETLSPPQDHDPLYEYFSEQQSVQKGDKVNVYIAFRVPTNFSYSKIVMKQNQDDQYLYISREIEFPITQK